MLYGMPYYCYIACSIVAPWYASFWPILWYTPYMALLPTILELYYTTNYGPTIKLLYTRL